MSKNLETDNDIIRRKGVQGMIKCDFRKGGRGPKFQKS